MKKSLFVLLIAFIILMGLSASYVYYKNILRDNNYSTNQTQEDKVVEDNNSKLKKIDNITDYYNMRACIVKYYLNYTTYYNENSIQEDKDNAISNVYNLLDKSYIEKYGITLDNLSTKMHKVNDVDVNIYDVLYISNSNNIYVYFVSGNLRDLVTNEYFDYNITVVQDRNTKSYSVFLDDYVNDMKYTELKEGKKIEFNYPSEIQRNSYNMFGNYNIKYEEYLRDVISQIREDLLYNPQRAYGLLDKDSKKGELSSYEKFCDYIKKKYKEIFLLTYESNIPESGNGYVLYHCKDKNNNFNVTIRIKYPMEYTYKLTET